MSSEVSIWSRFIGECVFDFSLSSKVMLVACGCAITLIGIYRYRVLCTLFSTAHPRTKPASTEWISRLCMSPRSKLNVMATHKTTIKTYFSTLQYRHSVTGLVYAFRVQLIYSCEYQNEMFSCL